MDDLGETHEGRDGGGGLGRSLSLAVTFLTAVRLPEPDPADGPPRPADLWASMAWYPLVGAAMGAAAWALFALLLYALTPLLAAALVVIALELASRALHLDGLMDTADGYFSGAPRERALEIMKDSRVGAMGVFAAIAVVVVKVSALAALARPEAALALLGGLSVARALPASDVRFFRYARAEGTGAAFALGASARESGAPAWAAAALGAAAAVAAGALAFGWLGLLAGLVVGAAAAAGALGAQALVARRLGGLTGDVYGMGIELAEAFAFIGAVVAARILA